MPSFQAALTRGDLEALRRIPRSDLHNHAFAGGNRALVSEWAGCDIAPLDRKLGSMAEMHAWVDSRLARLFAGAHGRLRAFEATLVQANLDGVTRLEIGEDVWAITLHGNSAAKLTDELKGLHARLAPDIEWLPQVGISRHVQVARLTSWLAQFLELGFYRTLDLSGDELAQPIEVFKPLYRMAKNAGLRLKAHVGEWGDADSVQRAVEVLELEEVQHGIAAARSETVVRFLADHGIRLNICPTSNVMLGRVDSLATHPVRRCSARRRAALRPESLAAQGHAVYHRRVRCRLSEGAMPTTWFIARDGKQHGPITDPEFRKLVELGHLKESDYVWHDGAADWMPATQFLDAPPAITKPRSQPEPVRLPGASPKSTELQPAAAPSSLSTKRRIAIAAIGLVAMVVVGVLAKLATDKVLGGLFATKVDRAQVEQQLLGNPKMKWLQILQEKQPQSYAQFMDALLTRLEKREPLDDSINYLRKSFVEPIFSANAPYLDDEAMVRYVSLIADQMEAFAQKNPALCVRLLHGRPVGDVRPYLTEALQVQELKLLEDALMADKTKQRRWYTQADQMKVMQGIVGRLSQQHGDRVQLINPATPTDGRERDACTIGIALFREIGALPTPNSAALMRSLLGAPK